MGGKHCFSQDLGPLPIVPLNAVAMQASPVDSFVNLPVNPAVDPVINLAVNPVVNLAVNPSFNPSVPREPVADLDDSMSSGPREFVPPP